MNTKNTFLAGAMLLALTAMPLAMAEDIAYFVCKVNKVERVETTPDHENDKRSFECGGVNESSCNEPLQKFKVACYDKQDELYVVKDYQVRKKMVGCDRYMPDYINRMTGEAVMGQSGGNYLYTQLKRACDFPPKNGERYYCTMFGLLSCEVQTEKTKF